ncbi:MAG TPA: DUF378 domain-containing protein [Candidatus Saccharibacteria bacterium]|jgi:uncharacterized membrane protein YuzA (DUF378 family)|nr:DUF378 domain-containing protein [Candidatus Saccharibacteria bacterium]HMT56101.1 DUF378 domain-containing protein [Candidatus Saccharibacteria bacterium]
MDNRKNALDWTFFILTVVGGLNWGLIGLFDFNLVAELFSSESLQRIIYSLVGLATCLGHDKTSCRRLDSSSILVG